MKNIKLSSTFLKLCSLFALVALVGCAEFNDPYGSGYGYNNGGSYNGGYSNDDYYRNRHERRELDRERNRIEDERERLRDEQERERQRQQQQYRVRPPVQDHCPSGYSPSEQKCSQQERRNGCKDMRLPSGLGCVRR